MTDITLNTGVSAYVLSTAPNRAHKSAAQSPVDSGQAITLIQFPLGNRIPAGAVVLEAKLRVYQAKAGAWAGSNTLTAQRVGAWTRSRVTWNNKPATSGSAVAVAQSDTANGDLWEFDVTADVTAFAAGSVTNYGWQITSSSTARRYIRAFEATNRKPELVVSYSLAPSTPTDLTPSSAAVSTTLPTLRWSTSTFDTFQVQVDDASDFATPTHDSGSVVSALATYNLASTAYAGNSGTAYWRVRAALGGQWSAWSAPVAWTYAAAPTVTITAPGATSADPSPIVQWTAAGQVSRRVIYRRASTGAILDDSGWATTTDLVYAPGFTTGALGDYTVEVQVRDGVEREAVPGFPDYGADVQPYTYGRAAGITSPAGLTVQQVGRTPCLRLTWTRASSPDEWMILRDGEEVARLAAADTVQADTVTHTWDDWTATVNRQHLYMVLPIVNFQVGEDGTSTSASARVTALWLCDPTTGDVVPIFNAGDVDLGGREVASVFETASGDVIRWVHQWFGASGAVEGLLADAGGYPGADESKALLETWRKESPGPLRLVVPPFNVEAQVGDIGVGASRLDSEDRPVYPVDLAFWATEES